MLKVNRIAKYNKTPQMRRQINEYEAFLDVKKHRNKVALRHFYSRHSFLLPAERNQHSPTPTLKPCHGATNASSCTMIAIEQR